MSSIDENEERHEKHRFISCHDIDFAKRFKNIFRLPYVKIYDTATGRCKSIQEIEFKKMWSQTKEELEHILDVIIERNATLSKAEIADMLRRMVDASISLFLESLKLVNFKGTAEQFPQSDVHTGDAWIINGKFYICEKAEGSDIVWRRLLTEDDITEEYYTRAEFDEKYVEHLGKIEDLVSGILYEYTEDFKNRFLTKEEFDDLRIMCERKIDEYSVSLEALRAWRDEQQELVDSFIENIIQTQVDSLIEWLNELRADVDSELDDLRVMKRELQLKADENDDKLNYLEIEVDSLKRAFDDLRSGHQEVLGERYEA